MSSIALVPTPVNEPVRTYAPGSPETLRLQRELDRQYGEVVEIPCVIGGREIYSGHVREMTSPCDHQHVIARVHYATPEMIKDAMDAATAARDPWGTLPWEQRAAVLLRAAELLAGPYRDLVNAATMIGQAKTVHQAEIDAACELIDFWRFNVHYYRQILAEQPPVNAPGTWNRTDHRPLDGFVFALTPFNFTSIALNLPTAPALVGNTVVWKPATTSALSAWHLYTVLRRAGLPDGVINVVWGDGPNVGPAIITDPRLAGIHFTGSTGVFQGMWRTIGERIASYHQYPRLVGETGGKDFILAHPSADPTTVAVAIARGGYEYQGQKCSAASRIYVPRSLWPQVRDATVDMVRSFRQGHVRDFSNFVSAVIDQRAFKKHVEYLHVAHESGEVLVGGEADGSKGWFVQPTLVRVDNPHHRLMEEEIFGPIVTAWVYEDADWSETLRTVDGTSPYALTGAIFADDRLAVEQASRALRHAAGNFYINDKPTGAVVGQQPFGGARASGTNDKAGAAVNLLRWISPRTIKETFAPPMDWRYPFLG